MADKNRTTEWKTPIGRLAYAKNLYVASSYQNEPNGRKTFRCEMIFPKTDRKFFEEKLAEVISKMLGGLERAKTGIIRSPLLAGDGKEARYQTGEKAGQIKPGLGPEVFFIRATAVPEVNGVPQPPPWVRWKDPNRTAELGPEQIYGGCYGKAVMNVFEWSDGKGVSFGFSGFQKLREGEPLGDAGSGSDPAKWVETIEDAGEAPPETKSGAGASGLFG